MCRVGLTPTTVQIYSWLCQRVDKGVYGGMRLGALTHNIFSEKLLKQEILCWLFLSAPREFYIM